MKKLTKIFATVLTVALAMSTVVMPVSANYYAGSVLNETFTTDGVAGMAGKDASDKVKAAAYRPVIHGYNAGTTANSDVFTYEAQLLPASGSSLKIILQNGAAYNNDGRTGMLIESNGAVKTYWEVPYDGNENFETVTDVTADTSTWNKVAIEVDQANDTIKWYLNGYPVDTLTNAGLGTDKKFNTDMNITGSGYVDNVRMYPAAYDPANDKMPEAAGKLVFMEDIMTVADAKAKALATQPEGKAAVHVYKDGLYGTEAADTETLVKGWYIVITSLSGDLYRTDGIYRAVGTIEVSDVLFADNTVTATVTNNGAPIESMMMVLVEDGGKFVMSSTVQPVEDTATFIIEGVDLRSSAEVFFVESWDNLAPVIDSTFEVNN